MDIEKRNGTIVPFDKIKIVNAINKAFIEVDGELKNITTATDIADEIESYYHCHPDKKPKVEDV